MQECKIVFDTPDKFAGKGLESSHPQLNKDLTVMDGVIDSNGLTKCAVVVLNISQQTVQLPKKAPLAQIEIFAENNCKPVNKVFMIKDNKTKLTDISHIKNINLTHVPTNYLDSYKTLLTNFADAFSRHDLDVGHCKTLPHRVRLTNPNKIVSINQYRLPYHCLLYTSPSPRD